MEKKLVLDKAPVRLTVEQMELLSNPAVELSDDEMEKIGGGIGLHYPHPEKPGTNIILVCDCDSQDFYPYCMDMFNPDNFIYKCMKCHAAYSIPNTLS